MSAFKRGDRVRVTIEDEIIDATSSDGYILLKSGYAFYVEGARKMDVNSFEKIEPPVVTYGVGDTVRHVLTDRVYTIGRGGFLSHTNGKWFAGNNEDFDFTSKNYEKINIG